MESLEDDPSVIEPDVLSKDRAKFDDTGDQRYVEKAHRRGEVVWIVGRRIEVAPHYRRPHLMLALVWTSQAVPKIVPRRDTPCVVRSWRRCRVGGVIGHYSQG